MNSGPSLPEYVLVLCYRCGTRMHPNLRRDEYHEKCPDCFTPNRVPPQAEVAAKMRPETTPQEIDTYRLVLPDDFQDTRGDFDPFTPQTTSPTDSAAQSPPSAKHQDKRLGTSPSESSSDAEPLWIDDFDVLEEDGPPTVSLPDSQRPLAATEFPANTGSDSVAESVSRQPKGTVLCKHCGATFSPVADPDQTAVLCPECLEDVPLPLPLPTAEAASTTKSTACDDRVAAAEEIIDLTDEELEDSPSPPAPPAWFTEPATGQNLEDQDSDRPSRERKPSRSTSSLSRHQSASQPRHQAKATSPSGSEHPSTDDDELDWTTADLAGPASVSTTARALPPGRSARRKKKRKRAPTTDEPRARATSSAEDSDHQLNPTATNPVRGNVFDRMADMRRENDDPPPRSLFLTSTFSFPWRDDTWLRWLFLTLGWLALGLLAAVVVSLYQSAGHISVLTIAFMALPFIWIFLWTVSYGLSCGMNVLVETAGGNDRIRAWPDPVWKEWMLAFFYVLFQLFVAQVLSAVVATVLGTDGATRLMVMGVVTFVLFPVVLLSSLEANSVFVPFTTPILRTFVLFPSGWLRFYLAVGAATALVGATGWFLWSYPFISALVCAPLQAAWFLVYFRLLGRLAWKASLIAPPDDDEHVQPTEDEGDPRQRETADSAEHRPRRKRRKKKRSRRLPPPTAADNVFN